MTAQQTQMLSNTLLRNQLVDDMRDYKEDIAAGQNTPYTLAIEYPDLEIGNPLRHMLEYEAFVVNELYGGSPKVAHVLSKFGSYNIGELIGGNAAAAEEMRLYFVDDFLIDDIIDTALGLPASVKKSGLLLRKDIEVTKHLTDEYRVRAPQIIDPRTYLSDAIGEINELLTGEFSEDEPVQEVIRYSLDAGGKRVRPGLTLMLAESLGVDREHIKPLLISIELAHTASLIFDDLPAQDNAKLRRGQPTAHIKFGEYDAQLAGISMISHGIGILGRLSEHFPPDRVAELVEYVGTVLGAGRLCLGQHMDLSLKEGATLEQGLEMYNLKTSVMIEGALMPLMILQGRPESERSFVQEYAYHACLLLSK